MLFRIQAFAILLGLLSLTLSVRATHIVGGEMYYDCLGNDVYRVTLKIYRDASPLTNVNQTGFDNQAAIGVYSSGGVLQFTERIPLLPENIEDLTAYVNNPCNVIELDKNVLWIQKAVYETTITLPPMPGGYNLVYQRCCRSPIVDNLFNAQNQGGTFIAHVPTAGGCNSMPQFKNEPPLALCRNDNLVFDHGATDADGDSLVYSLCTPYHGGSPMDPIPDPPAPPPHQTINWGAGFSANDPITANPGFSIDPNTGQLTGTPNTLGNFVFGVCVREYRNGNLLSEHIRDYQFIVVECEQLIVAEMEQQLNLDQYLALPPGGNPECSGRTINFQNNTANASQLKFFWNFGDPATDQDTSSAIAPTYTYQADGTYTVMLVVNPGLDCADTTTLDFTVQLPPEVYFTQPDAQCLNNNRFEFKAEGSFTPTAGIAWDFSSNATPSTSIAVNPTGITFDSIGQFPVSLTVIEDACLVVYTDTISVFPHPKANIALTDVKGCAPLTATLESQSFAWTAQQLFWEFGDGTTGTGQSPTHVYNTPGAYDVTLTVITNDGCVDTSVAVAPGLVRVYPTPEAGFRASSVRSVFAPEYAGTDMATIFDPRFIFSDLSQGATTCNLFFGNGDTSPNCDVEYEYPIKDTGRFEVKQVVTNQFGCVDSIVNQVFVVPEFLVYAPNAFSPNNDGKNDVFLPSALGILEFDLKVFNRFGEVIFESKDAAHGWDGAMSNGGGIAPIGVYAYRLMLTRNSGERVERIGSVTLVK